MTILSTTDDCFDGRSSIIASERGDFVCSVSTALDDLPIGLTTVVFEGAGADLLQSMGSRLRAKIIYNPSLTLDQRKDCHSRLAQFIDDAGSKGHSLMDAVVSGLRELEQSNDLHTAVLGPDGMGGPLFTLKELPAGSFPTTAPSRSTVPFDAESDTAIISRPMSLANSVPGSTLGRQSTPKESGQDFIEYTVMRGWWFYTLIVLKTLAIGSKDPNYMAAGFLFLLAVFAGRSVAWNSGAPAGWGVFGAIFVFGILVL